MVTDDSVQRARIYINENDRHEEQPLYLAVMERLRNEGATGATALRGLAGFGPSHRLRASGLTSLKENPPIVIEWIDRADRIARLLPLLDDLAPGALITIDAIHIHRAALRGHGPFANERYVGNSMQADPQAISHQAQLSEAITLLLAYKQSVLPVIDERHRVQGIITDKEIKRRAGLRIPLRILRRLRDDERRSILASLPEYSVAEIMNRESPHLYVQLAIPRALETMIEQDYDQLPVVDRDNTLVGLLSHHDVLAAALYQGNETPPGVREANPPTLVRLIMQTTLPLIENTISLAAALERLLQTREQHLLVVDAAHRLQGSISAIGALQHLNGAERTLWLAALQSAESVQANDLPGVQQGLEGVLEDNLHILKPNDTINLATRQIFDLRLEYAPVVDEEHILVGMLTRGGLLRALIQESD